MERVPRGCPKDHEAAEYLKFRQFHAAREFPPSRAVSPRLYATLLALIATETYEWTIVISTRRFFARPARVAALAEPEFATAIGLILYGYRAHMAHGPQEQGLTAKLRYLFHRHGA